MEGDRPSLRGRGGRQEDLRRLPQRDGRAAHLQGDRVPAGVLLASQRDPAPERAAGGQQQGHLLGVPIHGNRSP